MSISVGTECQVRGGAIDVTNGKAATAGRMYGEGGPLWMKVEAIVPGWGTAGKWGLPNPVTKYRCSNQGVVVWQVQEQDLIPKTTPEQKQEVKQPEPKPDPKPAKIQTVDRVRPDIDVDLTDHPSPYAPGTGNSTEVWEAGGGSTLNIPLTENMGSPADSPPYISASMFSYDASLQTPEWYIDPVLGGQSWASDYLSYKTKKIQAGKTYKNYPSWVKSTLNIGSPRVYVPRTLWKTRFLTSWSSLGRRAELRNMQLGANNTLVASPRVQNKFGYPKLTSTNSPSTYRESYKGTRQGSFEPRLYNYQIIPGDPSFSKSMRLEKRLQKVRAGFGIMVHGDNDIARSVKFYMYNRYKVPDTNLAHNKSVTHVFFTRPDLNLIADGDSYAMHKQVKNHTDTALMYRRYPELFKLLIDSRRCKDYNNFNMLLSNQISSFNITDEALSTIQAGRSWNEYSIVYGQNYTGRSAGEFTCTFDETSEYSVINLMKLWITYIDNVSRGAWYPNYTSKAKYNHVMARALDYAASVYVFRCGPDGEDVLYWSKYYGVFPIVTGAGALSYERSTPIGSTPSLSINFAYSMKRDMSPVSLLEFNQNARVSADDLKKGWYPAFDQTHAGSTRPFVGTPYIELKLKTPEFNSALYKNHDTYKGQRTSIRLKYLTDTQKFRNNDILYRSHHGLAEMNKTDEYYKANYENGALRSGTYVK